MNDRDRLDLMEFHKTNDMAQVTYLKLRGHSPQDVTWEGSTCYWAFRVTDGLMDLIDDFVSGEARVEPREYNRTFTQTKREFYDSKERAGR